MKLDKFLDEFLGQIISQGGIEKVKQYIKEDMRLCGGEYDTCNVECQGYINDMDYETRVEIYGKGYSTADTVSIECHLEGVGTIVE